MLLCEAIHKNLEHADTVGDDIARGMQKTVSEYERQDIFQAYGEPLGRRKRRQKQQQGKIKEMEEEKQKCEQT